MKAPPLAATQEVDVGEPTVTRLPPEERRFLLAPQRKKERRSRGWRLLFFQRLEARPRNPRVRRSRWSRSGGVEYWHVLGRERWREKDGEMEGERERDGGRERERKGEMEESLQGFEILDSPFNSADEDVSVSLQLATHTHRNARTQTRTHTHLLCVC